MASTEPNEYLLRFSDTAALEDAHRYLRQRQNLSSTGSRQTPMLRNDFARTMLTSMSHELNLPTKLTSWWFTRRFKQPLDFVRMRSAHLLHGADPTLAKVLRLVPVGTLPTLDFTAFTQEAPRGLPVVFVALGFTEKTAAIADWCAAATPYWGRPQISAAEAGAAVAHHLCCRPGDTEKPPSIRIRHLLKDLMCGGMASIMMNFAIAHEYGHIVQKIFGWQVTPRESEVLADRFASYLVQETSCDWFNTIGTRRLAIASMEIVIRSLRCFEMVSRSAPLDGHPPAQARLGELRELWKEQHGESILSYLSPLEEIFEHANSLAQTSSSSMRGCPRLN